ncbi:MAG: C10 family peptidase [Saprospiraceae bacterium]
MKKINLLFILTSLILVFSACSKDKLYDSKLSEEDLNTENYAVSMDDAILIAQNFFDLEAEERGTQESPRIVTKVTDVKESETDDPLLYIIEYESGFCLIAADTRYDPILAHSDENEWGGKDLPGPNLMIKIYAEQIKKIKAQDERQADELKGIWGKLLKTRNNTVTPQGTNDRFYYNQCTYGECRPSFCDSYTSTNVGPFIDPIAQWSQSGSFKIFTPFNNDCSCDRDPAGCGPVALAMIMRFHQSPMMTMTFNGESLPSNYGIMPRNRSSNCNSTSTAFRTSSMLVRLCGSAMNSNYSPFGTCNTSTHPNKLGNGLDFFGYTHDGKGNLDDRYNAVNNDLRNGFPVIMSGAENIFGKSWHIWVADGYRYTLSSYFSDNGMCNDIYHGSHPMMCGVCPDCVNCYQYSSRRWHMNWGWNGNSNGWFNANPFSVDDFDALMRVYTNIRS